MNEVEAYLRQSETWGIPISTDWRGRAVPGRWWPTYYSQWLDAHTTKRGRGERDVSNFPDLLCNIIDDNPGGWTKDDAGKEWWVSDTPDWDRQWFHSQGVKPPKRFRTKNRTYWKDYGGGLRGLSYR